MSNNNYMVSWALGSGRNFAKAQNKVGSWKQFVNLLSEPTVTGERRKVFDKMSKVEQDALKSVDGWVSGAQCEGKWRNKANVLPRDLITLDIDYAEPSLPELIETQSTPLSGYEFMTHSSRRHTDEKPRLRLILPSARLISKEEYGPLVRIISWMLDNERNPVQQVDKVSARVAQMMFRPTRSKDGDWFFFRNEGDLINPDDIFEYYEEKVGDWRDLSKLPLYEDEEILREGSDKAEDPTTKKGPVGDFCRAYEIEAAMEKFLPGVYIESDEASGKPRYTYRDSTSSNGAVVEDAGLFLYSHHGSDPVCEMLVNAFDLVRIHLFGEEDKDFSMDTPMATRPSWKAMMDHIKDDEPYKRSQAETKYDMVAMFDDVDDDFFDEEEEDEDPDPDGIDDILGHFDIEDDEDDFSDVLGTAPAPAPAKAKGKKIRKAPKSADWFPSALELDQHGSIKGCLHNAAVIIHNDFRLFGAIAFNDLSKQIVARRSIRSHVETVPEYLCRNPEDGDRWQDINDVSIRALLEAPNGEGKAGYGMKVSDRDLVGAVLLASKRNMFHPVKDYLETLVWDGEPRIDTMLLRYMGTEDSPYIREVSRTIMLASVVRIYEPGHKFDNAPILEGPQGSRKSSFIKMLYGGSWFGEIDCKLDDKQKIAETIQGKWVAELPELSAFHKSDHNDAKMFMRRQHDDVRMAYDRRVSEYPRQCVFWGSTNDDKYLKDPTGNRSYWPVDTSSKTRANPIDTDALVRERDQLWAEALALYAQMRADKPYGELYLDLTSEANKEAEIRQERARTQELHEEWAERAANWLETPIPLSQLMREYGLVAEQFPDEDGTDPDTLMVLRTVFRQDDIMELALGLNPVTTSYQHKQTLERAYPLIEGWDKLGSHPARRFGLRARWRYDMSANSDDLLRGYSLASGPDIAENFDDIL